MAPERPKLLFISAALEMSNSSAAIRNRRLVTTLSKRFQVDSIEFCASNAQRFEELRFVQNHVAKMPFAYAKAEQPQGGGNSVLASLKQRVKKLLRSVVPDAYGANVFAMERALSHFLKKNKDYNAVVISSDPKGVQFLCFMGSIRALKALGARLFQYWGDPWAGDVATYNNIFSSWVEKWLFLKADFVIFNSEGVCRLKKEAYGKRIDFRFLPRGFDGPLGELPETINFTIKPDIRFAYAGDYHSRFRDLNPFCEAIGGSRHELKIAGHGDLAQDAERLPNIKVLGRIASAEVPKLLGSADVLVVVMNRTGMQVPGKLYDYATLPKPIILLYSGHAMLEFIPFKERFIIAPNTVGNIRSLINELSGKDVVINFNGVRAQDYDANVSELFDCE